MHSISASSPSANRDPHRESHEQAPRSKKEGKKKSRFFRDTNSIQAATNSPTNVILVALELGGGEEKRYGDENFTKCWKNRLPRIFFRPSGSSSTLPEKDRQRSRLSPSTELLCFDVYWKHRSEKKNFITIHIEIHITLRNT